MKCCNGTDGCIGLGKEHQCSTGDARGSNYDLQSFVLLELWQQLGFDEKRVIVELARRLLQGQKAYGELRLDTDTRDFEKERRCEIEDLLIYSAFQSLKPHVNGDW